MDGTHQCSTSTETSVVLYDNDNKVLMDCAGEADQGVINPFGNEADLEPYVGMEFESDEAAKAWYNNYARHVGFSVRVGRQERSQRTKEIISRQFLCFREGCRDKRYLERKDRIRPEKPHTRVGCRAMIMLKKRGLNKWVLTRFEKQHNHELVSPNEVPFLRSHMHMLYTPKHHTDPAAGHHAMTLNSRAGGADFELTNKKPVVRTQLPMEEQVAELYTRTTFLKFQEELCASLCYVAIKIKEHGELCTYKVTKFGEDNRSHTVVVDLSKMKASCTCLMFEFVRILCRHALIVFRLMNVLILPSHYIIKRYVRNVRIGFDYEQDDTGVQSNCADTVVSRYVNLCHQAIKYAEEGAISAEVYNVAMHSLKKSFEEISAAKQNILMNARLRPSSSGSTLDDNLIVGNLTDISTNQITSHDQPWDYSKGCPDYRAIDM